ncbi:hypothetical protein [Sandaracinus amylolyticus]|uniref:hypothetical protein n=1 Tax=Sandaracinus amylolyticus TaxID=927083 RepID=UPI001F2B8653|nr:hypothetical protein [Sandaracinus amylolyticus]UJR79852.1 Hypothetical protein I5071_18910 [Sandaracinus amylolyticus]
MTRIRIELHADYRDRTGVLHPAGATIECDRDAAHRLCALGLAEPAAELPMIIDRRARHAVERVHPVAMSSTPRVLA